MLVLQSDEYLLFFTVKRDQFWSDHQHRVIIILVKQKKIFPNQSIRTSPYVVRNPSTVFWFRL